MLLDQNRAHPSGKSIGMKPSLETWIQPAVEDKTQEEITPDRMEMLLSEVVPGMIHRASNLLMEISGKITLASLKDSNASDQLDVLKDLPNCCNRLAQVLQKMSALTEMTSPVSKKSHFRPCLLFALSFLQASHPEIQIDVKPEKGVEILLKGDFSRICNTFRFILLSLAEASTEPSVQIEIGQDPPPKTHNLSINSLHKTNWLHLSFRAKADKRQIQSPREGFYNPTRRFDLIDCQIAAAENIVQAYHGRMEIQPGIENRIDVYLPQVD